jgi:hypothetical protein
MSELTDLLLRSTSPVVGLMLVVLFGIDVVQVRVIKYFIDRTDSKVEKTHDRVARVEDHLLATDGGEPDDGD